MSRDMTDEEWQDPDQWEPEGWLVKGSGRPRLRYVVVFEADEAAEIESTALRAGLTTIQFIHRAALEASKVRSQAAGSR